MPIKEYFDSVANEIKLQSDRIRDDFKTHRPTSGANREAIVAEFLRKHLPSAYGVVSGLILAQNDMFSKQADVVIVDQLRNAPLYSSSPEEIWLVESVYCLLEVKTRLTPSDLADSIEKCRRFKSLPRSFMESSDSPRITDSLFAIWSFETSSAETLKTNFAHAIAGVPISEQPDFVIVPDKLVIKSGSYHAFVSLGMPSSPYRSELEATTGGDLAPLLGEGYTVWELGTNALLTWFVWIMSWLNHAGPRVAPLTAYLPKNEDWGREV